MLTLVFTCKEVTFWKRTIQLCQEAVVTKRTEFTRGLGYLSFTLSLTNADFSKGYCSWNYKSLVSIFLGEKFVMTTEVQCVQRSFIISKLMKKHTSKIKKNSSQNLFRLRVLLVLKDCYRFVEGRQNVKMEELA